jgi:putative oxygen-independent coproporphyrinogen III oxidase
MSELSVYVHFPWCLRKCPYCDFATAPSTREQIPHRRYAQAVLDELAVRAEQVKGHVLRSLFFGGGTPSLWEPSELGEVLRGICASFGRAPHELEVTVECNPSSLDAERARALCDVGVNRLSLGVQSLDDGELRFLGRLHDRALALEAVDAALAACGRVSADLMFALPGQSEARFLEYVDCLLERGLSHVSAYALTIEPATPFGAAARKGLLTQAPEELYASLFLAIERRFEAHGLGHYEVSNYAREGEQSEHNVHYWRGGSYLGLGAAAVGCLGEGASARRYRNHPDAGRYMERAASARAAAPAPATLAGLEVFEERLDAQALIREALMLGLRMEEGVDLAALERRVGVDPRRGRERALERRLARGDLALEGERLTVPRARWLMLDGIVADLF